MKEKYTTKNDTSVSATTLKGHTYFWGGVFSQWFKSDFSLLATVPVLSNDNEDGEGPISYEWKSRNTTFNCAEQYMMYWKAYLFDDIETCRQIMNSSDPREQKALGRSVKNFDAAKWDEVARDKVYMGNWAKFTQVEFLYRELMNTEGTILVEASPYDKVWGVGLHESDSKVHNPDTWEGTNYLGEVLTVLRDNLKISEPSRDFIPFKPNAKYRGGK